MNEAWIALAAALFGGAGLKAIEAVLNRPGRKADIQAQFRDELRSEIDALRKELRIVDNNLRYWRERYYAVVSALNLAKSFLAQAGLYDKLPELDIDLEKDYDGPEQGKSN